MAPIFMDQNESVKYERWVQYFLRWDRINIQSYKLLFVKLYLYTGVRLEQELQGDLEAIF